MLLPVVADRDNHTGPVSFQVYGACPPVALSEMFTLTGGVNGDVGQPPPAAVICKAGTVTVRVQGETGGHRAAGVRQTD